VTYLASDALKGRGNGTPELDMAADYIAERLSKRDLKPAGENGTYFQPLRSNDRERFFGPKNELAAGRPR